MTVQDFVKFLENFAPPGLAEEWDNTGLLVGTRSASVEKAITCLTLTPDVAEEAIQQEAQLIVSHHPVLFRPVQRLTDATAEGRMLLDLIAAGVAVYSPHTSFDSASAGINQQLAEQLRLTEIAPIRPTLEEGELSGLGSGRWGRLRESETLAQSLSRVRTSLKVPHLQYVGELDQPVSQIAVACGSAAEFLREAERLGCDLFITGEARFHSFLEARSLGLPMVILGHYASERPAVEQLAKVLQAEFPAAEVWASRVERDPVQWSLEQ
ncbi:MAG: Nif3-like dinuclear metal center hexameric protein [Planctomycetaceae bacterium]|nr:Nif3-like dinuclear metal center hexameric protein [Planctomycetaceae bacterium]